MSRIKGKQVNKLFASYIRVDSISVTGTSAIITTEIANALLTAGNNGTPVALALSTGDQVGGIVAAAPNNRVEIFDAISKEKFVGTGEEVYGRLTELAGVYTLSFYFKDNSGVETVYTFGAVTPIEIEIIYRFQFGELPTDTFIGLTARNVNLDAGETAGGTLYKENTTVTGVNILANLTYLPTSSQDVILYVNTKPELSIGGTPSFTTTGTTINWLPANAGYDLDPTDVVTAEYTTLQI